MVRLYHPKTGAEIDVPDDEGCIAVHVDAGWKAAPEPESRPGYEPEPVTYAPVTATKTKPKTKTTTTAPEGDDQ